jgi:hypothetical protein
VLRTEMFAMSSRAFDAQRGRNPAADQRDCELDRYSGHIAR